jgi:PAS domain S-box-containing protein
VTLYRPKRSTEEIFSESPQLRGPTIRFARRIFRRFFLLAVGLNALVGIAVVVYDVADNIWTTKEHLRTTSTIISKVALKLRARSDASDRRVVQEAADLTQAPMALLDREGRILFATAPQIRDKIGMVFPDGPVRGTRVVLDKALQWLGGAWMVSSLSKRHDLLAIAIRHPEEEGRVPYVTRAAGLIGLGVVLSFLLILAAANWMLRHPLHRLVDQLTGALQDQLTFRNNLISASESVGIVAAGADGKIRVFNPAAERILGLDATEVVNGMTLEQLRARTRADRGQEPPPELLAEGEEIWIDRAGEEHLLSLSTGPILDTEGQPRGSLLTFVDITERRRLEADLRQSELQLVQSAKMATLGEMATGMAHELNQPLNNIGLLCSRLQKRQHKLELSQADREFFLDKLEKLRHQVDRAGKIIDHLRTFGRPTIRSLGSTDVRGPITRVVDLLREPLQGREIRLRLALADDLPPVLADEAQLEQVLLNLVVNARDAFEGHTPRDGQPKTIRISASAGSFPGESPTVQVRVSDNGPGMSEEVLERVFEPFFTTKEVGKGTGLGLSISYGLVRDFGGQLTAESDPRRGTTFTITLKPAAAGADQAGSQGAA